MLSDLNGDITQFVGNVRKQVHQIAKEEQDVAEAKEAAEQEKLMKV